MNKTAKTNCLIVIFLFLVYTALWFAMAGQIRTQIPVLEQNAVANGVTVKGTWSDVSGFPFRHRVTFSGDIVAPYGTVHLPETTIKGFFLPTQIVEISAPHGGSFTSLLNPPPSPREEESDWSALMKVDFLTLQIVIPSPLPKNFMQNGMAKWQQAGGKLVIPYLAIKTNGMSAEGAGVAALDELLQLDAVLTLHVTGHQQFVGKLQQLGLIKGKDAIIVGVVLTGLSKPDPKTQEPILTVSLTLKNQTLSAGPLALATLPPLVWQQASDNPPAPR